MCVIMVIDDVRPSPEMVKKAWDWNDDFGGVAWREGEGKNKVVCWKKGIENVEDMQQLVKDLPTPFVAHFRIASSSGGQIDTALNHPFPINKKVPLELEGKGKDPVFFHNGDWKGWDSACRDAAIRSGVPIPKGQWSDTRGIAWLMAIYPNFMSFLPEQRGVLFSLDDEEIFTGPGWEKVNGIWCSNNIFMNRTRGNGNTAYNSTAVHDYRPFCKHGPCSSRDGLDHDGWCSLHTSMKPEWMKERDKKAESGGTQAVTPFPKLRQGQVISLELAERLHDQRDSSGNRLVGRKLIQKIRNLHIQRLNKGTKGNKAQQKLLSISKNLSPLMSQSGRVH